MFRFLLQKTGCVLVPSQWHAEHLHALLGNWEFLVSPPHNRVWVLHLFGICQLMDSTGLLTTRVPDLGLRKMDVDVGAPLHILLHEIVVVQESGYLLRIQQPVRDGLQALMKTQTKEQWHQRIALLDAFALGCVTGDPTILLPQIRRRLALELPDEGRHLVTALHCHQPGDHGVPGHEVKSSHALD